MRKTLIAFFIVFGFIACNKNNDTPPAGIGFATINSLNDKETGESARDLLTSATYSTLKIEIQYMPGMQLQQQSVNNLLSFLNTYLNKPGGISVTQTQVNSIGKDQVSLQDIASFEAANRTAYTNKDTIAVYIVAANSDYTNAGVVGVAYRNTSICVFEKMIQYYSGGLGQSSRVTVESGTLEHEFGHLLGLVNDGTPMVKFHADIAHPPHCNNQNCLMYYEIETAGLMNMFNNAVPSLDSNCIADLEANGGK